MTERRQTGIYASCTYHENSLKDLARWLEEHEDVIPLPIDTKLVHTTIVYSRDNFEIPAEGIENFNNCMDEFRFYPKGFALLGRQGEDKKALVLLLDAEPLMVLHEHLKEHGASHDFDDYIPHLTVSYEIPPDFDLSPMKLPDFWLKPEKINFEPLNNDWCLQDTENVL